MAPPKSPLESEFDALSESTSSGGEFQSQYSRQRTVPEFSFNINICESPTLACYVPITLQGIKSRFYPKDHEIYSLVRSLADSISLTFGLILYCFPLYQFMEANPRNQFEKIELTPWKSSAEDIERGRCLMQKYKQLEENLQSLLQDCEQAWKERPSESFQKLYLERLRTPQSVKFVEELRSWACDMSELRSEVEEKKRLYVEE